MSTLPTRLHTSRGTLLPSVLALLFSACAVRDEPQGEWPQWRGPQGMGVSSETNLPTRWSGEGPEILWKTPLPGHGNSSPIVSRGSIYLTVAIGDDESAAGTAEGEGEDRLVTRAVMSLDLETGRPRWTTPILTTTVGTLHQQNTVAAPTPVAARGEIYAFFGSVLARLDEGGDLVWKNEVKPDYLEHSRYGASSSLVLTRRAVIVPLDRERARDSGDGWLGAFDRESGEELWRAPTDSCCTYSTPLVIDRGAGEEVLWAHSGYVASYDAATGERLWSDEYEINQLVSSPIVEGDLLIVSGGAHNVKHTLAWRLTGAGRETQRELLWEKATMVPQTSSPVLYQGVLYTITEAGVIVAYEPLTGKELWKGRLRRAGYQASLVAGDGKIYASSRSGMVCVLHPSDHFEVVAENDLGEPGSNATPAIADQSLILRGSENLYRVAVPPS